MRLEIPSVTILNSGFARAVRVSDLEYGFADGPCHGLSGLREREGETKTKACGSYRSLFLIVSLMEPREASIT